MKNIRIKIEVIIHHPNQYITFVWAELIWIKNIIIIIISMPLIGTTYDFPLMYFM